MLQLFQIPGKRTTIAWQTAAIMCSPIPFVDFYFRSAGGLSDWDPKVTYYFDSFLFFLGEISPRSPTIHEPPVRLLATSLPSLLSPLLAP